MSMARFSFAPGALTALAGRADNRAYYIFSGDLSQMGRIETFLRSHGFPVVKRDVYPGFAKEHKDEFVRALKLVFEHRLDGWWNQEAALIEHGVCTRDKYRAALGG